LQKIGLCSGPSIIISAVVIFVTDYLCELGHFKRAGHTVVPRCTPRTFDAPQLRAPLPAAGFFSGKHAMLKWSIVLAVATLVTVHIATRAVQFVTHPTAAQAAHVER
jgi:hypothetical protein